MNERKRLWSVIPPDEVELHAFVGMALRMVQGVESVLRLVMTIVIQKDGPLDLLKYETQTKRERKRTLGYFLTGDQSGFFYFPRATLGDARRAAVPIRWSSSRRRERV